MSRTKKKKRPQQRVSVNWRKLFKSSRWKKLRLEALAHYGSKCEDCGGEESIRVTHRHYSNVGNETVLDVKLMCAACHDKKSPRVAAMVNPKPKQAAKEYAAPAVADPSALAPWEDEPASPSVDSLLEPFVVFA